MSEWKFKEQNQDTRKKYWDKKKTKKGKEGNMAKKEQEPKQATGTQLDRGNYNADIVADQMEERDEQKEKNVREAMGLPQND